MMLKHSWSVMIALALSLLVAACSAGERLEQGYTPPSEIQAAFDAAIAYLQQNYPTDAPASGLAWAGANITPEDLVGSVTYAFESGDYRITIQHGVVAPEYLDYSVNFTNKASGFTWSGVVSPSGSVQEVESE